MGAADDEDDDESGAVSESINSGVGSTTKSGEAEPRSEGERSLAGENWPKTVGARSEQNATSSSTRGPQLRWERHRARREGGDRFTDRSGRDGIDTWDGREEVRGSHLRAHPSSGLTRQAVEQASE